MKLPLYQLDAFTTKLFGGNPACVCPLENWLPDDVMQSIAAENNVSETSFFVREGDGYLLRWFTPEVEVDLCGHATLAAAYVIFNLLNVGATRIAFRTVKSGVLTVTRNGNLLTMDFPSRPPRPIAPMLGLAEALGQPVPVEILKGERDHLVVYQSAADVAALAPDFAALIKFPCWAVICTAPGDGNIDFVSRFFAPWQGVPEDPVTGSAHCTSVPYWSARLDKTKLEARQISKRVGAITCELNGDRVFMTGRAMLYLEGAITI